MGPLTARVATVRNSSEGIGCHHIGKWEDGFAEEVVLPVALGTARLRKAIIHAEAVGGTNPLQHSVENNAAVLSLVEAEMPEVVERAGWLGNRHRVDPPYVPSERVGSAVVIRALVAKPSVEIADCGGTHHVHGRILCDVGELVDVVGDKVSTRKPDRRPGVVGVRPSRHDVLE